MRVPANQSVGASGETLVKYRLETWGWGPIPVNQHDNGTDLLVQVRDEKSLETGAVLGVQVKKGSTFFDEPFDTGEEEGWVFRMDARHRDYWVSHYIPHIIVLVDAETEVAYWEKITPETTHSTGKGWKVLVPAKQKLDLENKGDLFKYGVAGGHRGTWEGTIWGGKSRLRKEDELRAALLTPRILAPHLNEQRPPSDFIEAIACILTGRLTLITRYGHGEHEWLTKAGEASQSLTGNLYYALKDWFSSAGTDDLHGLTPHNAASNEEVVALAVCRSVACRENNQYEQAKAVLKSTLYSPRNFSEKDLAWLLVHYAGVTAELGAYIEAEEIWDSVFLMTSFMRPDPSVRALMATSVSAMFSARTRSSNNTVGLKGRLNALDNQANLWVAQLENRGLAQSLIRSAKMKLHDRSITIGANDTTYISLRAASMVTGLSGDFKQWNYVTRLLVFHMIVRYSGTAMVESCAKWARQCLTAEELRQFYRLAVRHGVHEPLNEFASDFDPAKMTVGSVTTDLALIGETINYLDQESVSRLARWAVQEIESDYPVLQRLGSFAGTSKSIRKLLVELYPSADSKTQTKLRNHLLQKLPVTDGMEAQQYSALLLVINPEDWTQSEVELLKASRIESDHVFRSQIETMFFDRNEEIFLSLSNRMKEGDETAYLSVGPNMVFPEESFCAVIAKLKSIVSLDFESSKEGISVGRTYSAVAELARLSLLFPQYAEWNLIVEFAEPNLLRAEDTEILFSVLIDLGHLIPGPTRDAIANTARNWINYQTDFPFFPEEQQESIRARATHLFYYLNELLFGPEQQGTMLTGNRHEVQQGLLLSEKLGKLPMSVVSMFLRNETPEIRDTAISISTRRWMRDQERETAKNLLNSARSEQPFETELQMLNSALQEESESIFRREVLEGIRNSQFVRIRNRAVEELRRSQISGAEVEMK